MGTYYILLLGCLALIQPSLSQAPFNYDNQCRTSFRYAAQHIFPDNVKILLDSYDYENLLNNGDDNIWESVGYDGDSVNWQQTGGICQQNLRTCTYTAAEQPQNNWVFTQYISYEGAQEIFFNITFRLTQCTTNPNCHVDYVNLHRFDVSDIQNTASRLNPENYVQMRQLQQTGTSNSFVSFSILQPSDPSIQGFYLGFEDVGTCGTVSRILAYSYRAPGFRNDANLVTCPDTALPHADSNSVTTSMCICDDNSKNLTSLERSCNTEGVCVGNPVCACKPGYELGADGRCSICPLGTFKATVSNTDRCTPCPANSVSTVEGAEVCPCDCNTVRPTNQPGADCSRPPSSPLVANDNTPLSNENGITLYWLPATEDGGHPETLHYNVYVYSPVEGLYIKNNREDITLAVGDNLIEYTLNQVESVLSTVSIVVTSATVATGDEPTISDLSQVQNRFILFYVSLDKKTNTAEVTTTPAIIPTTNQETPTPVVEVTEQTVDGSVNPPPALYFTLGDQIYLNGSTVSLDDIAEGDNALLCHTHSSDCCRTNLAGEFYYPDGGLVPVRAAGESMYRNRGDGFIRLNYNGGALTLLGRYRCVIPDINGALRSLFITIQ